MFTHIRFIIRFFFRLLSRYFFGLFIFVFSFLLRIRKIAYMVIWILTFAKICVKRKINSYK